MMKSDFVNGILEEMEKQKKNVLLDEEKIYRLKGDSTWEKYEETELPQESQLDDYELCETKNYILLSYLVEEIKRVIYFMQESCDKLCLQIKEEFLKHSDYQFEKVSDIMLDDKQITITLKFADYDHYVKMCRNPGEKLLCSRKVAPGKYYDYPEDTYYFIIRRAVVNYLQKIKWIEDLEKRLDTIKNTFYNEKDNQLKPLFFTVIDHCWFLFPYFNFKINYHVKEEGNVFPPDIFYIFLEVTALKDDIILFERLNYGKPSQNSYEIEYEIYQNLYLPKEAYQPLLLLIREHITK